MKVIYMHKSLFKKCKLQNIELPPDWRIITTRSRKIKRKKCYLVDMDKIRFNCLKRNRRSYIPYNIGATL